MRNFFEPTAAPSWLKQVLNSLRAALGDTWPFPLRLKDYATADLPAAADFRQGLVWDSTSQTVKCSTGAAWASLSGGGGNLNGEVGAAPGSGSGTLTNAAKGIPFLARLRAGQCGLFRWDDGADWELRWGFWNGTAVTRPANGFVASSTGSALSLSAAAFATLIGELGLWQRGRAENAATLQAAFGSSTPASNGIPLATIIGTPGTVSWADTGIFTREPQIKQTGLTVASADAGRCAGAAHVSRNGGFHFACRFGSSQLPTGPRLAIGLTASVNAALGADPSAMTDVAIFGKDQADTNIQFMVNDASGTATKASTGIALGTGTLYEANIWADPAGNCYGLLVDYSNGALWYGSATGNLPTASTGLGYRASLALNGTNTGTAAILHLGMIVCRTGV
jgi:hypothetical protein